MLNEAANRVYLTAPDGASLQVVDGAANAVIRSVAPPAMAGARGSYRPLGFDAAANWLFDS